MKVVVSARVVIFQSQSAVGTKSIIFGDGVFWELWTFHEAHNSVGAGCPTRKCSWRSDGTSQGKLLLGCAKNTLTLAIWMKRWSFSWVLLRCPSKALWVRDSTGHSWKKGSCFGFDISVVVIFFYSLFGWYFELLGKARQVQNRSLAIDL